MFWSVHDDDDDEETKKIIIAKKSLIICLLLPNFLLFPRLFGVGYKFNQFYNNVIFSTEQLTSPQPGG